MVRMAETIPEAAHKDVEDKWVSLALLLRDFLEYVVCFAVAYLVSCIW